VQIGLTRVIQLNAAAERMVSRNIAAARLFRDIPGFVVRRRALRTLLAALCVVASGIRPAIAADGLVDKRAPEFVRTDLNHRRLDLKAYRGKVVLLSFWATWCGPCLVEMPRFVEWQKNYGPRGLQVVGISMDDGPAPVRNLYRRLKLNYPVAMGDESLGELYGGILGLPVTFLIDRHGEVIAKFQGETDLNTVEMQVQSLLHNH
jgi:cytochrome c biogenesis protein CcmG/thiol:disulfide interchange protein DsbE